MPVDLEMRVVRGPMMEALARAPRTVPWAVDRKLQRGALETARTMRANAPKAESTLTNSIQVRQEALMAWRVGPSVEHAAYQEEGTRGGGRMPPLSAIEDWVRTKLHIADPRARRDAAWPIARAIQRRGVPAQPFVRPIYEDPGWQARIEQLAAEGVRDGLRRAGMRPR
jgi:hypothetical protein